MDKLTRIRTILEEYFADDNYEESYLTATEAINEIAAVFNFFDAK